MNTFETPDQVRVKEFNEVEKQQRELNLQFLNAVFSIWK